MTNRKQELHRQLRFVRRNPELIGNLVRLRAGMPIDPEAHPPPPGAPSYAKRRVGESRRSEAAT